MTTDEIISACQRLMREMPRHRLVNDLCSEIIDRAMKARAAHPKQGDGAGGGEAKAEPISQSRRDWMANYMRDYRAGRRRREAKPPALDT